MERCVVCARYSSGPLCGRCQDIYLYDKDIGAFRLKKNKLNHKNRRESRVRKCLKRLFGAQNVYEEVGFQWCKNPDTGCVLRFDFLIRSEEQLFLMEFNGRQHYKYTPYFHDSKQDFRSQKKRDNLKKKLAKRAKVPLIVIPYNKAINDLAIWKAVGKKIVSKIERPI